MLHQFYKFTRPFSALALICALLLAPVQQVGADPVIIDTFDQTNQSTFISCDGAFWFPSASSNLVPEALGGARDLHLFSCTGGNLSLSANSGNPFLSFALPSATTGTAHTVWDGPDGSATTLTPDGLCSQSGCINDSGADLTDGGANIALHVRIVNADHSMPLVFRIYSGGTASDYLQYTVSTPGDVSFARGDIVSVVAAFNTFTTFGAGASFSNVGAIEIFFNGSTPDADVAIDIFEAIDAIYDLGDLPDSYGTLISSNGPRHLAGTGLRLGNSVDVEPNGQPGLLADGDNFDDGVVRSQNWSVGVNGGAVEVTVRGCATTCRLNGWVDWNNDGAFDISERIFSDVAVTNGTVERFFNIPGDVIFPDEFYARFRLCSTANECNTPVGEAADGEVEDYFWRFGPTAITLQGITAAAAPLSRQVALMVMGMLFLTAVTVGHTRRRK